jgi:hypothetical protein
MGHRRTRRHGRRAQAGQAALAGEEGQATELVADALENAQLGMEEIRELARGSTRGSCPPAGSIPC